MKKAGTIDLQERVMALREETFALREENLGLKAKVKELEEKAILEDEMEFDGRAYWRNFADGGRDGAFCQCCFDEKRVLIRLQSGEASHTGPCWYCSSCKNYYQRSRPAR